MARLFVLSGASIGATYEIDGTSVVGRGADADVVIPEPSVSRKHARLVPEMEAGVWKVVDLGSGFTSWALRDWAQGRDVTVHSVDDSPEWLEKTRGYLAERGFTDDRLHVWPEFAAGGFEGSFDLVVHDLGFMDTRFEVLDTVVGLARPGGLVLLDDMHKPDFRDKALTHLEAKGLAAYSLKRITRDRLTRFAYALPIPG